MAKVALLIGVSEYEPGLNPLPASVKDVQAIAKVLQHPEMCGFAEADIHKLENPDPQKMQEAIETLFSDRHKEDLVLLYFSGHGIKDESGKLYLATRLTRKNPQGRLVKATAVPANFIHNIMSDSRSKRQVVILDCCFSGAFAEGLSAKDDGSVDIHTQLGGEGRVVLTSSTSTQYSFQQEGDNLSIYTRYVVEGIETGAADQDNDGVISIDELHEYAKKKVKETAPAMQPEIYAVKEGFKIRLAKAPVGDPKLKYRQEVELFASRGVISGIGRYTLELKRQSLGLLPEEATIIETEVLQPYQEYQKRLQRYEHVLVKEINRQYPFDQNTRHELTIFQQALGLKDEDIQPIWDRVAPKEILSETKRRNSPQRSIRNGINIVVGMFILAGVISWMVINILINPSQKPSPSPASSNTPTSTPKETPDATLPTPLPSPTSSDTPTSTPTETPQPPFGTASKSWCLAVKESWEFRKNEFGEDKASDRASMEERNCNYWGITLPTPQSNTSSPNNSQTGTRLLNEGTTRLLNKGTPLLPGTDVSIPSQSSSSTTENAAKSLCIQEKDRYKILIKEGAVSEQAAKSRLNDNNCRNFGITWP